MLWHAESRMHFDMVGGHLGNMPPSERPSRAVYKTLERGELPPGGLARLRRFLAGRDVTVVVVAPGTGATLRRAAVTLGTPTRIADVLLIRPEQR
jgi:hypothetical protein